MMPADQFKLPQEGSGTNTEDLLNAYAELNSFLGTDVSNSIRAGACGGGGARGGVSL